MQVTVNQNISSDFFILRTYGRTKINETLNPKNMVHAIQKDSKVKVEVTLHGGEELVRVQKSLLLAIESIASDPERAGDADSVKASWTLSNLLREFMLDESQTNTGVGGKAYTG
ncbi:MAG: hypothetical protein JNL17_10620 [Cyclobacteriaceae bacterium]|nr:hypothetical protein [Cyclobacteriaceae bacterium]